MAHSATLNDLFFDATARHAALPAALRAKAEGEWRGITHRELRERVHAVYAALREIGVRDGDRVAILSENRPEWAITDYACLAARCTDVPVYPTLPTAQVEYILRDAGCRVAFCSTAAQAAKLREIRPALSSLEFVIVFDAGVAGADEWYFPEFETMGASRTSDYPDWEERARAARPGDLATLIYTSGTTGDPKGVMLSHGNIASNVDAALQVLDIVPGWSCLSFLPLSHIFERMVGHYTMLQGGVTINYASSFDAVAGEMLEVRPDFLASVPRLYEKIYARVIDTVESGSSLRRALFEWARATADRVVQYHLDGGSPPGMLRLGAALADRLVFRKLRGRLGGRLRFAVSGGAPLNPDICRFFLAAGVPILEGYGLTETSPVITVNPLDRIKPGTVGLPIPGVEISVAEDGEILTRGPHVMEGYYHRPDDTAEVIDRDGWFHTGDIGEIDADGYLRITDRKKDLIVTAGGKNIAPQPIEALLKTHPLFSNAVMLGDKRPYPVMLLVPDFGTLASWARAQGIEADDPSELVTRPEVKEQLEREARKSLRNLAQFETPKKFLILPTDFTIASGELTPKLSVRRKVVLERWKDQIEALYSPDRP